MRFEHLARGHGAVGHGQLDGSHQDVALPDAHVHRVAAHPGRRLGIVPVVLGLPLGRRDAPDRLAGKVDARQALKRVLREEVLQSVLSRALAVVPELLADVVEHRVARLHDAAAQVEPAVAVVVPAQLLLAGAPAVPRAGAGPPGRSRGEAVLERGEARERLVGGRGGVLAADGAVHEGVPRLLGLVEVPRLLRDDPLEHRGIERGVARHGDDPPVGEVHDHHRARHAGAGADGAVLGRDELSERAVADVLHGALERKAHIGPLRGLHLAHYLHDVAVGVRDHRALAVVARQKVVVVLLDAGAAHHVVELDGAPLARRGEVVLGDRAGVAQHVRGERAVRVVAHAALLDVHAGKRVGMLGDEGRVAQARVARHHALALRAGRGVLDALAHHVVRHAEQRREPQHDVAVVGHVGIGQHGERRAVSHERKAVGVADEAAGGGLAHRGVFVRLRRAAKLLRLEDLHHPELGRERAEDGGGEHAHRDEAGLQAVGGVRRRARRGARAAHRPRAASRGGARLAKRRGHAHRADGAHVFLDAHVGRLRAVAQDEHDHGEGDHDDKRDDGGDECDKHGPAP